MKDKYKYYLYGFIQMMSRIFCVFPIQNNKCIFMSHRGASQYSDSPMYISEELQRRSAHYKIVWLVNDIGMFQHLQDKGIKIVKYNSFKCFYEMNTARICVTNCGFFPVLAKRKNQLRINTLHGGGAYKSNVTTRAGLDEVKWSKKLQRVRFGLYNLTLSGCRLSSEINIKGDFCYNGEILEKGMPRNDIFFRNNSSVIEKVKTKYDITDERILLVAPTWRDDNDTRNIIIDYERLANKLCEQYGGEWKIFLRPHHLTNIDIRFILEKNNSSIVDVGKYPNIQELLLSADMLITDYSSLIWDYLLQNKPAVLYTPDLIEYSENHGFNVPVEKWGLPYACTEEELMGIIDNYSIEQLKKCAKNHLEIFGSFESGIATKSVCDRIEDFIKERKK